MSLDNALVPSRAGNAELMALDEALASLSIFDERKCRIVEMRLAEDWLPRSMHPTENSR